MAAARLSAVAEESTDLDDFTFTVAYPPCNFYRGLIRRVAVSGGLIRSTLFSQYGYGSRSTISSYSSQSGASSYPSNNSGYSSGSAHAASGARTICDLELREIARLMVVDGFTQRMVHGFHDAPNDALGRWFSELDVDWVLQIREGYGIPELEAGRSEWSLQDFVETWIRALAIIVLSMRELHLMTIDEPTVASAQFGRVSIAAMLAFVDAIVVPADAKAHGPGDRLWAVLNMYVCVSDASSFKWSRSRRQIPQETQSIIDEINGSLSAEENRLNGAIFSTMEEVRTFMEEEDSWAAEIPRGGGEVHRNTHFIVDCVVLIRSAVLNYHFENLRVLIHDTMDYLKDLLWRKSELCSDESLRYLFLLNNSCFVTQQLESSKLIAWTQNHWEFPPESKKYIDLYFEVSWAHVLSCISESKPGPLRRWNNGSSLARFLSAFHKIYKLQKFWKVQSPELRHMLRKTITERVISGYREYLEEHPELEKRIIFGNTTPDELEEMLGELFEG